MLFTWRSFKHPAGEPLFSHFAFYTIHIRVYVTRLSINSFFSVLPAEDVQQCVYRELQTIGYIRPGSSISSAAFSSDVLKKNVVCVKFGDISELLYNYSLVRVSNSILLVTIIDILLLY